MRVTPQPDGSLHIEPVPEFPEWLPTSEAQPDGPNTVLVSWLPGLLAPAQREEPVWLGYFDNDADEDLAWLDTDNLPFDPQPTHWMDLPKPPTA